MTRQWFDRQMARLGVLKFAPDTTDEYFAILHELPEDVFTAAVTRALESRVHFPVPAELLADADAVAVRPTINVQERRSREWAYFCDECSDTGWHSWWCGSVTDAGCKPWLTPSACGRPGNGDAHTPHGHVTQCACWETNPKLVREREAARRYAKAPQPVRKR